MLQMSTLASAQLHRKKQASLNQNVINQDESDDEPLLDDDVDSLSESISAFGRTTMFFNQRQQLRTALKNFFMNPFEKYTSRGRVPWKLIFHVLKLISLTVLLLLFGQDKFQLRTVLNAYKDNLGSLLVKDYTVYDSTDALGNAIHRHYEIADATSYSLINYFNLTNSAVGIFGLNVDKENKTVLPVLCITSFQVAEVDVSQWKFDFDEVSTTECSAVDCSNTDPLECREKVFNILPDSYDGFIRLNITFEIRTVFLSVKAIPKCVQLYADYTLRNMVMSGSIVSEFTLNYDEVKCNTTSNYKPKDNLIALRETLGQVCIDASAIILCLVTAVLVIKRIRTTFKLYMQTRNFYSFHYNRRLTWTETTAFLNGWDFFSIFADVLTLVGVFYKVLLDTGADQHLDITAVIIGSAVAINWILGLRFLSFDKGYYILVLTISVAMPNILRLLLCISAIYMGYVFCGWVVFGPYVHKFCSISQTTDTLFALINGDEILDTFMQVDSSNKLLFAFSKVYFYSFIMLFIYVVLSVMISLIGDAMIVAQSAVQTGIGHWLIGADVFPELSLGWKQEDGAGEDSEVPQTSSQKLNNSAKRL